MPYWMIHEGNKEQVSKPDGTFIKGIRVIKNEKGEIISETEELVKANSIKYVRFLIDTKSAHLIDVLQKFMSQYQPLFSREINNI